MESKTSQNDTYDSAGTLKFIGDLFAQWENAMRVAKEWTEAEQRKITSLPLPPVVPVTPQPQAVPPTFGQANQTPGQWQPTTPVQGNFTPMPLPSYPPSAPVCQTPTSPAPGPANFMPMPHPSYPLSAPVQQPQLQPPLYMPPSWKR